MVRSGICQVLGGGGAEAAGPLGLIQAPSMTAPECMQNACAMQWMSAQDGAGRVPTQTGLLNCAGEWLWPRGSGALPELAGSGPPLVPQGLGSGPQNSGGRAVQLGTYDGKMDLRAYLAQFDCVAKGNGWSVNEGTAHLTAALCGG